MLALVAIPGRMPAHAEVRTCTIVSALGAET